MNPKEYENYMAGLYRAVKTIAYADLRCLDTCQSTQLTELTHYKNIRRYRCEKCNRHLITQEVVIGADYISSNQGGFTLLPTNTNHNHIHQ